MKRVVGRELLDGLPASDPEAIRSRRDLRVINALMGNFRWLRKRVEERQTGRLVEIGAGDGQFLKEVGEREGGGERVGVDLVAAPEGGIAGVEWVQGDVFTVLEGVLRGGELLVANLFLHHLDEAQLRALGGMVGECAGMCISEPLRSRFAMVEGYALCPLVNRVTRHDMMASIRAGFRRGELPALLGLDAGRWEIREQCTLLGACRMVAWRR